MRCKTVMKDFGHLMSNSEMAKQYEPSQVEAHWYEWWQQQGLFRANDESDKPSFCISMPPPNVTGSLHMGHALTATLQDILIRYKRMAGFNALWVPGTDHAGIATQMVVERELAKENVSRFDLGRDAFVDKVWEWKHQYHNLGRRSLAQFLGQNMKDRLCIGKALMDYPNYLSQSQQNLIFLSLG